MGLRVVVGTDTLVVFTWMDFICTTVSFFFYNLIDGSRVYFIIMLTSCSRSCPCLSPMVCIDLSGSVFCRYSDMPFSGSLVSFYVELSILGYFYGNNLTLSVIISVRFFTS